MIALFGEQRQSSNELGLAEYLLIVVANQDSDSVKAATTGQ